MSRKSKKTKISSKNKKKIVDKENTYLKTYIDGLDQLLVHGIPNGASILVCGGTGSGKTILNLQILYEACRKGKKCIYITLEEAEQRLMNHMRDFGWDAPLLIKEKKLRFLRINPFDIMRNVDALLAKEKGELVIEVTPMILPKDFRPDMIFIDSLTAISAAFVGRKDTYRIYIEKLFRYFEEIGTTTFLITETDQIPLRFSPTGTEEFLADGVIILYAIRRKNRRIRAIEVLKMRGVPHKRNIVLMDIIEKKGVKIHPEKEIDITF